MVREVVWGDRLRSRRAPHTKIALKERLHKYFGSMIRKTSSEFVQASVMVREVF